MGQRRIPAKVDSFADSGIIEMHCLRCGKRYTRNGNGLMLNADGSFKPCNNGSPVLMEIMEHGSAARCESTSYKVYRQLIPIAMPIGRVYNDLRPRT